MIKHLGRIRNGLFSLLRVCTLGSSVIAIDADNKVLMVRNSYSPDHWRLPGGGLKRGESFRSAALRETNEEVGIELEPSGSIRLLSVYHHLVGHWNNYIAVYVIKGWTRSPVKTWEVTETALFDPSDLPANTAPAHRRRIAEWLDDTPPSDIW